MKLKILCHPQQSLWLKKIISSGLALGLIFNNISVSLAGVISEDGRYETFEGNNITIDNILEEDNVDVEIEGNTLVNLATVPDESHISYAGNHIGLKKSLEDKNVYRWEKQSSVGYEFYPKLYLSKNDKGLIQPNKTYTIQYKIKSSQNIDSGFCIANSDAYLGRVNNTVVLTNVTNGKNNKEKLVKEVFTTNAPTSPQEQLAIGFGLIRENEVDTVFPQWVEISDLVILEGDWSNTEIPSYFDGLKSFGELENPELMVKNKNILPNNFINKSWVEVYKNDARISSEFIPYKKNQEYTVYGMMKGINKDVFIEYSDHMYEFGETDEVNITRKRIAHFTLADKVTFVPDSNYKYMAIYVYSLEHPENYTEIAEISLCEGDTPPVNYVEPLNDNIKLNLKNSLKSLPNGVSDKIIEKNGQWVVERNCREVLLDGSESWTYVSINSDNYFRFQYRLDDMKSDNITISNYCDRFIVLSNTQWTSEREKLETDSGRRIGITISGSKLSSQDLKGFKEWLQVNPTKVVYQLVTPIYEPIENIGLTTYLDTTHISNNSTIPTSMKITVDRVVNRAQEAIELVKLCSTMENLSNARYWTNLLKESTKKDELNDEINNINKVEDLTIEKKTTTVNVDLYIKPQNSLSMSLSTNSIIFDEFDSTEDIEKLKAIDITVESSLPYRLNSYLVSEIKNKDSSNIIPKEQFNIRLNGEADYKAFNNINEKLVLKDDCLAGVDNIHSIDLILKSGKMNEADVYKTTLKFEAEQK